MGSRRCAKCSQVGCLLQLHSKQCTNKDCFVCNTCPHFIDHSGTCCSSSSAEIKKLMMPPPPPVTPPPPDEMSMPISHANKFQFRGTIRRFSDVLGAPGASKQPIVIIAQQCATEDSKQGLPANSPTCVAEVFG